MAQQGKIMVDCERMKYPHTGLYHYCQHLGDALVRTNRGLDLCFYTPASLDRPFGKDQCYLKQRSYHKMIFPSTEGISLWHSTHQSTDYYPKYKKLRIVLTIHDLNYLYDQSKSELKRVQYVDHLREMITRADHIVTISKFTLGDVERFFDIRQKPCTVIYNGCNIVEIAELKKPEIRPSRPFLFTIGTIVDKKNFHVLPALLKGTDYVLLIAGITQSEDYREKIMDAARKEGVDDRVVFTGPVSENDKQWYLKHCAAFVFPSISEGFGLPVVEAMYFGKPVLLSNHTSLPEIGGDAAYYFPSFEPGEMRKALSDALHHFEANDRAAAVKERAAFFNWDRSAEKYHEVYRSLLV